MAKTSNTNQIGVGEVSRELSANINGMHTASGISNYAADQMLRNQIEQLRQELAAEKQANNMSRYMTIVNAMLYVAVETKNRSDFTAYEDSDASASYLATPNRITIVHHQNDGTAVAKVITFSSTTMAGDNLDSNRVAIQEAMAWAKLVEGT